MLNKIKSKYILHNVLIHVNNIQKLNILRFNERIQNKLEINIIDYRRLSGKYQIIKDNELKIYNSYNNRILFEGQYSNENKNLNGKEYNEKGDILFEGEYYDGKKWNGTEKEYDEDTNNLIFEYKYSNGKVKAKEFDKFNGDLLFEGEYLNGKRNGYGEEYKYIPSIKSDHYYSSYSSRYDSDCKAIFRGEYLNGERKEGIEYDYKGNIVYEGRYLNGKKHGKGKIYKDEKLISNFLIYYIIF